MSPTDASIFLQTSGQPLQRNRASTLIPLAKFGKTVLAKFGLPTISFIHLQVSGILPQHSSMSASPRTRQRGKRTFQRDSRCTRTNQDDHDSDSSNDEDQVLSVASHVLVDDVHFLRCRRTFRCLVSVVGRPDSHCQQHLPFPLPAATTDW